MIIVNFKSTPENYHNERTGLKCNTIRKVTTEDKFIYLKQMDPSTLKIKIHNTDTDTCFERQVSNVTFWTDPETQAEYAIISWRPEKSPELALIEDFEKLDDYDAKIEQSIQNEQAFQRYVRHNLAELHKKINKLTRDLK